jgi:hypothetical protein
MDKIMSVFTMNKEDSAFTRFERRVKARFNCQSAQPEGITGMHNHSSMFPPQSNMDLQSPPLVTDNIDPSNEIWNSDFQSKYSRLIAIRHLQSGVSLSCSEMSFAERSLMTANKSLEKLPSKLELNISPSQGQCNTSSGSMLPPIHFLLGPAFSEHLPRISGGKLPLHDIRHTASASEHSSIQPASSSYPPIQGGATSSATLHNKSSWRRTPKRWGLAEWERDDSSARERRREQNREAQRRFREKRHRAAADLPSPPLPA